MRRRRPTSPRRRIGFTLIELLVVIVILGLLVGLIVPAVMRAVRTAKEAAVAAEIQALGQALAQFKTTFGDYPPSRILVSETGDYSTAKLTLPAHRALGRRTVQYFKKFWPRMPFNTGTALNTAGGIGLPDPFYYDFNGSGQLETVPYVLSGPECLVLFLGGAPQQLANGEWAVTGFAKNPLNPFLAADKAPNRVPPYFEFVSSRLKVTPDSAGGFPGFLDSLGSYDINDGATPFYVYFSAYGGAGYDPDDCNMRETDSATGAAMSGVFVANNAATPTALAGGLSVPGGMQSAAPNPYTSGPPIATLAGGSVDALSRKPRIWQNAQTYQIISAGADRIFGIGGQYSSSGDSKLPWVVTTGGYVADSFQTILANQQATGLTLGTDARARERDNVTNFSQGKLE